MEGGDIYGRIDFTIGKDGFEERLILLLVGEEYVCLPFTAFAVMNC